MALVVTSVMAAMLSMTSAWAAEVPYLMQLLAMASRGQNQQIGVRSNLNNPALVTSPVMTSFASLGYDFLEPDPATKKLAEILARMGRFLSKPVPKKCAKRRSDFTFSDHEYQASWLGKGDILDWLDARNFCREQCMDLVSVETSDEGSFIEDILEKASKSNDVSDIWTSGRLCDFHGCDEPRLQPILINGWFWSGSGASIAAKGSGFTNWGAGQPDQNEPGESCVAILSPTIFNDPSGIFTWHDIECHNEKPFLCEDSDELINYAKSIAPDLTI